MKFDKLRDLSAVISLVLAILVFLAIVLTAVFLNQPPPYILASLIAIGSFILIYVVTIFLLENFVHNKIKLIYRSINSYKSTELTNVSGKVETDLAAVSKEVEAWGEAHKSELEDFKKRELFRREFIGNLAHEIKTPIFNIQGYILTLLEGAVDDPDYNIRYLNRAQKSVERMILLINDLDEISKLESGVMELHKSKFNIVDLAKEVKESVQDKAKKSKTKIIIQSPSDKGVLVSADEIRIRQVLENLLNNSIKYGRSDGLVQVRFNSLDNRVLVEVIDDGPGIAGHHLPRLFERFYRVDTSRSRDVGGSGLGLAICKHIIEGHGERISVRSQQGEGTVFSFSLKLV